jgi:replicative DNA helicase
MATMQERADALDGAEAVALAGMFIHADLTVPAQAFRHPGRRALVTAWQMNGVPSLDAQCLKDAEAMADGKSDQVRDAMGDIDASEPIARDPARWRESCSTVIQAHATKSAAEHLDRVQKQYDRGDVGAAAVAKAWERVAAAEGRTAIPTPGVGLMGRLLEQMRRNHGRKTIGIDVPSLPQITKRLDGLRGLAFLGGEPGTGKTALAMQMAFDGAEASTDVVAVFVTCEMSPLEITAYLASRLARIVGSTLLKGRETERPDPESGLQLRSDELRLLREADERIASLGQRWSVVAPSDCGGEFVGQGGRNPFAPVVSMVDRIKAETGATRSVVVFDSLQAMPVAEPTGGQWRGEQALERDRYVIAKLNELTDGGLVDAVIVTSEQNKAGQGTDSDAAFLGTNRINYAADATILLYDPDTYRVKGGDGIRDDHFKDGFRHVTFRLKKGRMGMDRGPVNLTYDFWLHRFEEGFSKVEGKGTPNRNFSKEATK